MIKNLFKPKMINKWLFTVAGLKGDSCTILEWAEKTWVILEHCYNDPNRHYHNFDHIYDCLKKFEKIQNKLHDPLSVELAIWFHDIVYNPMSKYSEDDSAELAYASLKEIDEKLASKVAQLIKFTKWDSDYFYASTLEEIQEVFQDADTDFFYLRDIDWSGFSSSKRTYSANTLNLRAEVPYISDKEFYARREAFLKVLVALPRPLYCTEYFADSIGETSMQNIKNELSRTVLKNKFDE